MNETDQQLKIQNDQLKEQLMSNSLINELVKVMHSCTDLEGIIKTVLLGIQEILGFDRVILFDIDKEGFSLKPNSWVGIDKTDLKSSLTIPLGFEGGEIPDSIFLNKHIIVEGADADFDIIAETLDTTTYLVIPLVSKATRKC